MSTRLATKDDFAHLESLTRSEFARVDQQFASLEHRFASLEQRFDLELQNLETRLLVKLGALVTLVVSASTTILTFLR